MRIAWAALLLAGCGQAVAPSANAVEKAPAAPNRLEAPAENRTENAASSAPAAPDPAALQDLSPRQRRAYEKGYADCRAGRYEPDPWPEAYRIGCAAANDR